MGMCLLLVLGLLVAASHQFEYKHHNNEELPQILEDVHANCPNISRIYSLSEGSVRGVPLYIIEFSTNPGHHEISKRFILFIILRILSGVNLFDEVGFI